MFRRSGINKILFFTFALLSAPAFSAHCAEESDTARMIKRITPPIAILEEKIGEKDSYYFDTFYESNGVIQGNRTGRWNELDTAFGYKHKNVTGYLSFSQLERFDLKDYTANLGSYLSFKDSYFHMEAGFGWDVDYIYKFQSIFEYGRRFYKTVYWQMGYNYRGYDGSDVHMVYPSLIYYFGDSYMSATYGASFMEGHDTASFGTVKGDFAITEFLRWSMGLAFGERLYDINGFDARQEQGYIMFTGINLKLYKGINIRAGYSYGAEKPKFIKRGMNFGATVKF